MRSRGSHTDSTAPVGSVKMAMRPASNTSNGSIMRLPPSSPTRAAVSSADATVT